MLSFLYVYSDHSILECYNLFSGVELSMRSFFCYLFDVVEFLLHGRLKAHTFCLTVKVGFAAICEIFTVETFSR